jgi:hypothetical protein
VERREEEEKVAVWATLDAEAETPNLASRMAFAAA